MIYIGVHCDHDVVPDDGFILSKLKQKDVLGILGILDGGNDLCFCFVFSSIVKNVIYLILEKDSFVQNKVGNLSWAAGNPNVSVIFTKS